MAADALLNGAAWDRPWRTLFGVCVSMWGLTASYCISSCPLIPPSSAPAPPFPPAPGVIWHKQANRGHRRHIKSSSRLTRLKRLKPLDPAYARKFNKLGFK